ncbi:MAG: LacI family DNA-binding transcriptional regulator [Armatimonadota bacterium]
MAYGIVKLDHVAKLAGVSKSTVSRILAASPEQKLPYSEETQKRVRESAEILGYRPSKLARGLTQKKTGIIGLVIPSIKDSFFPGVTSAIESRLAKHGYSVILADTNADSETERSKIHHLLDWRIDGLIVACSQSPGDAGFYWQLWERKIPMVLIDRFFHQTPFYSVVTDDHSGSTQAVEHLLSLGHTNIACTGSSLTISTNKLRHSGYIDSLIKHGILPNPALFMELPSIEDGGSSAVHKLLEMTPRPTALFCFTDLMAIGAMKECLRLGIRIPEDLALVGYADLAYSDILKIPLTSVCQPQELLGDSAADMLIAQLEGRDIGESLRLMPVNLVIRESTIGK